MRIPEQFFCVINPLMRMTLHSPAHVFFSDNVLIIKYQGRRSGKSYEIPVRYIEKDGVVKCFTDKRAGWWPNLKDNSNVILRIGGRDARYETKVYVNDQEFLKAEITDYLNNFPGDAVYHDVRLDENRRPLESDIDQCVASAVAIFAHPIT